MPDTMTIHEIDAASTIAHERLVNTLKSDALVTPEERHALFTEAEKWERAISDVHRLRREAVEEAHHTYLVADDGTILAPIPRPLDTTAALVWIDKCVAVATMNLLALGDMGSASDLSAYADAVKSVLTLDGEKLPSPPLDHDAAIAWLDERVAAYTHGQSQGVADHFTGYWDGIKHVVLGLDVEGYGN